jgi:hypothetical protein
LYRVPDNVLEPADDILVWRCEEIDAATRWLGLDRSKRLRLRPPLKPITLGALACAAEDDR